MRVLTESVSEIAGVRLIMKGLTDKEKLELYEKVVAILIKQRDELRTILDATNELLLYFLDKPLGKK